MASASTLEPEESAREAGLRHVRDNRPGITRHRAGTGVFYRDPSGERITDRATIDRITALAIPPAWTDVWICPSPNGHLQATGRDAEGRKQYRYHPKWREFRDRAGDELAADRHNLPPDEAAVLVLLHERLGRAGTGG